jgi:hypothetical protein
VSEITKELAKRLCKVAPERFAFWQEEESTWGCTFLLGTDWGLADHSRRFTETILYASAWALNEMRSWDKENGFKGLTYSEQVYWLRSQVMNLTVDNLEPVTVLELFCEWKETFKGDRDNGGEL